MLGKIKSMVTALRAEIIQFLPLKGMAIRVTGNDTSNPSIISSYNVDSVTRTGVGVYRLVLTQETFFGIGILANAVSTINYSIEPSLNSDLFSVQIDVVSLTEFDIKVYEVAQGTGNRLDISPYDIQVTDTISGSFLLNINDGRLPPE